MPMHGAVSARSSYKSASVDLCNALDEIARVIHLCMSTIHPQSLSAFVACRLIIPLKKNPGVSPAGIGEVSWRIIGKSILRVVGEEEYGDRMREVKMWCIHSTCVFNSRRNGERENCCIRTLS